MRGRCLLFFELLFSFTLGLVVKPSLAWGAACCGGGAALPGLILGDHKAQISTSLAWTQVAIENVDGQGIWYRADRASTVSTWRFEGAHAWGDRWQSGLTLPLVQRSQGDTSHSGMGDLAGTVAYEYLTDWDYHPWRPKALAHMQLIFPTGRSRAESLVGGMDSRGNGFWAVSLGTTLTRVWGRWDCLATLDIHHSFAKRLNRGPIQGRLVPGWGGLALLGTGYSWGPWRTGASLLWTYEDPVAIRGPLDVSGGIERYATATAQLSYLADDDWTVAASYSDQTLFGRPLNTSLGRTASISIQRRWPR